MGYDDSKRNRRFRRNISSHNYPPKDRSGIEHTTRVFGTNTKDGCDGTSESAQDLINQLIELQEKMKEMEKQLFEKNRKENLFLKNRKNFVENKEDEDENVENKEDEDEKDYIPKRKKLILLTDSQKKKMKRKRDDDETYEEGKKTPKKHQKKVDSDEETETDEDEEPMVAVKPKKVNRTLKQTNRQHRLEKLKSPPKQKGK